MKKIITLALISLVFTLFSCDRMNNSVDPYSSYTEEDIELALQEIPVGETTDSLESFLQFIREEEKLARDVYIFSYDKWQAVVFERISHSEQKHMDAVKLLLDRYGIEDPVGDNGEGVFVNQDLQNLYTNLTAASTDSLSGALLVGAEIEEIDILDIKKALEQYTEEDVQFVLDHLMRGSYMHLKAYVKNLEAEGIEYSPKYLTQEEYDEILAYTPGHRGGNGQGRGHGNGHGRGHGRGHGSH